MVELLHRLRRRLWLLRNPMLRVQMLREQGRCLECGAQLTDNERTYYESNCNRCEAYSPYAQPDPHGDGVGVVGNQPKEEKPL